MKTQFEVWKYLPFKIFLPKYLSYRLRNSVHLAPTFFKLLYLLFIFYIAEEEQKCVLSVQSQLVSQIYIESETVPKNIHPNILSEIIGLHKNEGRGGNLAQISNWQLYIGRAASHSAVKLAVWAFPLIFSFDFTVHYGASIWNEGYQSFQKYKINTHAFFYQTIIDWLRGGWKFCSRSQRVTAQPSQYLTNSTWINRMLEKQASN